MSDYPTDEDLESIRSWPPSDPMGWFSAIKHAGHWWPDESWGWSERDDTDRIDGPVRVYEISTGGWSGNEEILSAMEDNRGLWYQTWREIRRGGHYTFMVKK
jgi:1,4-alpha-glucan branching enzyme